MKVLLYVIIIVTSLLVPTEKADIAKLQPVEAVMLRNVNGNTEIYTDTGAWGIGRGAWEALEDLKSNTPDLVYLDTAKYLIVDTLSVAEIENIRGELKGRTRLCCWNGDGNLSEAVRYLSVRGNLPKLKNWKQEEGLPEYVCKNMEKIKK